MKYLYLAVAIVFEVIGSSLIKVSDGFTKLWPTVFTFIAFVICFYALSIALRSIPLGIAYASWAGLGIVLTALVSLFVFKQSIDLPAMLGMGLIIAGVIVINFFSKSSAH
ncbi:DMT family transporter [Pedobacter namyangjuensis]|uniref:DMT family transporter n=1 Tax=Pedobacter namyangjuensis TaxID=600626 RepID=UPI001962999A|nr:SMR family transporter [Pedobacter namyangjuensis]